MKKEKRIDKKPKKIILVAGARPNFMKIAPIWCEMIKYPDGFKPLFVHTGQHYDDEMSRFFLEDLELPEPDICLNVGSASHGAQTAKIMIAFEKVVNETGPDLVVVVGDVNSTLACALVAVKMHVPVAHIEAGLRSRDRTMPEEINRILTDQISDYLFTTEPAAGENLQAEGIDSGKIHYVGNTMIHSLIRYREKYESSDILKKMNLIQGGYVLVTLHRPKNVDHRETFQEILDVLLKIGKDIPVIFPAHPRTQKRIREFNLSEMISSDHRLRVLDPLGYFDFIALEKHARLVLTDSGGIQEETTFFQVPCLTIRENTERPITISKGTNVLVGTDPDQILKYSRDVLNGRVKRGTIPKFWDDQVARRIVDVIGC
ncbi:UDP-N-acetylglucosamine 2-epimerase (non-hydrolyzing) [bacterium]|nr:UDP-N-acetylglucosamine 2-epimerase (non-hydrolyzing) [bacterium]RQV99137.1 MAG: UDP-N-acetylglucosamine 2-epimerase (non-hydrolyzing) [bacterium]